MSAVELTIKGDIEVLRLQPGDVIVVTLEHERRLDEHVLEGIRDDLRERFPDHEVLIANGLRLSVQRPEPVA